MDISVPIGGVRFNARVAVLLETPQGWIFEHDRREGFWFAVGGRIKTGESSHDAALREVAEEIGLALGAVRLRAVIENFFSYAGEGFHEFCHVYVAACPSRPTLPEGFSALTIADVHARDVRPALLRRLIPTAHAELEHIINRD